MPLLVRNNEDGPAVFTDFANNIAIEWQSKGDAAGEDIQQVPESMLENPAFTKALNRGIFEVVEGPAEIVERVKNQIAAYRQRRGSADEVEEKTPIVDQRGNKTIAMVTVETSQFDNDKGKAIEKDIPVIMAPREYA